MQWCSADNLKVLCLGQIRIGPVAVGRRLSNDLYAGLDRRLHLFITHSTFWPTYSFTTKLSPHITTPSIPFSPPSAILLKFLYISYSLSTIRLVASSAASSTSNSQPSPVSAEHS